MSSKILPGFMKKKGRPGYDKGDPEKLFELLECLGEGTYGTVWTGLELKTKRTCAVKIVTIDDDLEEIEQEIAIMRDSNSPYIVKFYGAYWADQKKIWMVMEHCIAGSLNDLMYVCDITLNADQIRTAAAAMTMGLRYLHSVFVIHRDIKAGNVLLTAEGHIRLADFGVSAKLKSASDRTNTAIGAPFWMAPEVINEVPYDGRADVWSLGITLIELAEGRPPNSHINPMKALFIIPQQQPPTLQEQAKWPKDMVSFVKNCLVKDPKKRPKSEKMLKHPFIAKEAKAIEDNDGRSVIMADLVKNSLRKIENWRKDEEDDSATEDKPAKKSLPKVPSQKSGLSLEDREPDDESYVDEREIDLFTPEEIKEVAERGPERQSLHLNPLKDGKIRESMRQIRHSARRHVEPLRDVIDPSLRMSQNFNNQNDENFTKGHQKELSIEDVANIMNSDLPAHSNQVQAAVMTKEFIVLLKSIYRNDPKAFGGKPLKNWTGEDITVAVVKALHSVLGEAETNSNGYTSNYKKEKADYKGGNLNLDFNKEDEFDATQFEEEKDLKMFMNPYEFDPEKDGDMPPPPPLDSDEDSDIEI